MKARLPSLTVVVADMCEMEEWKNERMDDGSADEFWHWPETNPDVAIKQKYGGANT